LVGWAWTGFRRTPMMAPTHSGCQQPLDSRSSGPGLHRRDADVSPGAIGPRDPSPATSHESRATVVQAGSDLEKRLPEFAGRSDRSTLGMRTTEASGCVQCVQKRTSPRISGTNQAIPKRSELRRRPPPRGYRAWEMRPSVSGPISEAGLRATGPRVARVRGSRGAGQPQGGHDGQRQAGGGPETNVSCGRSLWSAKQWGDLVPGTQAERRGAMALTCVFLYAVGAHRPRRSIRRSSAR